MLRAAQDKLLWSIKDKVLVDNMDLLSRNLEPRRHYGYLRSALVLNVEDQETIDNSHLPRSQRAIKLIDIIRTKGPTAFDALCRSMEQDKTQVFLLAELNKSLEREIDAHRAMLNLKYLSAQHVYADDLPPPPPPELPSVISTTNINPSSSGKSCDSSINRMKGGNDLTLQYSIEEEDGGSSQAASQPATLSQSDTSRQPNNSDMSEC